MTQESGIYDHWLLEYKLSKQNSFRVIDPIINSIGDQYEFEAISLNKLSGIFCLYYWQ
jgi:hypothetical protein